MDGAQDSTFYHEELKQLAKEFSTDQLTAFLDQLIHYQQQMKWVAYPRILLEMAFIRFCSSKEEKESHPVDSAQLQQLEQKVNRLEQKLANSSPQRLGVPSEEMENNQKDSNDQLMTSKDWTDQLSIDHYQKVKSRWLELLQKVKETRITVYAWLVDGELVGATPKRVIVAFKVGFIAKRLKRKRIKRSLSGIYDRLWGILIM